MAVRSQAPPRHKCANDTAPPPLLLRSMAEDADDFPSDSAVRRTSPSREPTGEEADAPSDVEGDAGEDCAAPAVEAWNEELALDAETALLDRCLGVDRGALGVGGRTGTTSSGWRAPWRQARAAARPVPPRGRLVAWSTRRSRVTA